MMSMSPPRAMLPSNHRLCGRYARGHLVLDHGHPLKWTPQVGIQPDIYVQDSAAPCTLAELTSRVYSQRFLAAPILVCGVADPARVWELFPPGSLCGSSFRDSTGLWTVWALPIQRAATLLQLVGIAAAVRPTMPRIFLTVWHGQGSVTPAPASTGAYLELSWSS